MLKKVLIAVVIALLGLAVVIALQPATFRVTRTATIAAAPADVFSLVNDFHNWDGWSPWAKLDPTMKTAYAGPASGSGAIYSWVGNSEVGEGRMTIADSQPASRIAILLEFKEPFASRADTLFEFAPAPGGTTVTWTMSGDNDFLSKAFSLFMGGMEKMIGPDFEKGLAQLKAVAEGKK
jgi:hypothetical protein